MITFSTILILTNIFFLSSSRTEDKEWTPLLDKNLSKWEAYLSYSHTSLNITGPPEDSNGKPMKPVGLNNDTAKVFTIII